MVTVGKFLYCLALTNFAFRTFGQHLHQFFVLLLVIKYQNARESPQSDLSFSDELFDQADYYLSTVEGVTMDILHIGAEVFLGADVFEQCLCRIQVVVVDLPDPQPILNAGLPPQLAPGVLIGRHKDNIGYVVLQQLQVPHNFG